MKTKDHMKQNTTIIKPCYSEYLMNYRKIKPMNEWRSSRNKRVGVKSNNNPEELSFIPK